ncbi:Os01g0886700 [Oryza sativa Japonica Group]|uniref:Os01g0886700 protein n=1 Tax=Oryza sativa subsp. japonica TaxID=39947 RepID=C7IXK9_ORYSJ|nr:Os01g0886700 [Oryza sativa Japonica Group]|eukprot:NP_001172684.1 Os01g0886700 [Oryza sativa Japonica Group]
MVTSVVSDGSPGSGPFPAAAPSTRAVQHRGSGTSRDVGRRRRAARARVRRVAPLLDRAQEAPQWRGLHRGAARRRRRRGVRHVQPALRLQGLPLPRRRLPLLR